MATSALCGSGGVVTGAGGGTEITNWTIEQTIEAMDATSMSSAGWTEAIACLKGASGTYRAIGVAPVVGSASATFKTAATGGYQIAGTILVRKVTEENTVDDVVSFTADFVFTGAITIS